MLKYSLKALFILLFFTSCQESETQNERRKSLIHEGMSASELREVLGDPKKIENESEIFDAQSMSKMSLEQWVYEKRVVLLINDTVKNSNLNSDGVN